MVKKSADGYHQVITDEHVSADVSDTNLNPVSGHGVYTYVNGMIGETINYVDAHFTAEGSTTPLNGSGDSWLPAAGITKVMLDKVWLANMESAITSIQYISRADGRKQSTPYYLEISQDDFATSMRSNNICQENGETGVEWEFDAFTLDKTKPLYMRGVNAEGNSVTMCPQTKSVNGGDSSCVFAGSSRYSWICRMTINTASVFLKNSPRLDSTTINSLNSGSLWGNGTASLTLTSADGIAMNSANGYGRVEVKNNGVVITSKNEPQWLDATTPAFYNIRTTKDLTITDATVNAIDDRVTALEQGGAGSLAYYTENTTGKTATFSSTPTIYF